MNLTALQRKTGLERLADPDASEGEVMRRAGYSAMSSRLPQRLPGGSSRALAVELVKVERKELTPAAARELALSHLKEVISADGVRDDVRVVAAKQLLDYGLNAPDLEPELTGKDARAWRRAIHREARMQGLAIALRLGADRTSELVSAWQSSRAKVRDDAAGAVIDVTPLDVAVSSPATKRKNKGQSGNVR